jgi:Photosynthetic reaction centre cytochrome C subunit
MSRQKMMVTGAGIALLTLSGFLATKPEGLEGPFKNLQVLSKKISGDKMELIMGEFNAQLGVTCGYCHPWRKQQGDIAIMDFASDEKTEKKIARLMLRMSLRINRKYFDIPVNPELTITPLVWCRTCHKGLPRPSMLAPLPGQH